MVKTLVDSVERYKLNTEFFQEHVQHTDGGIAKNKVTVKGYWSSVGEPGRGGSGVVRKQIHDTTGNCRALKIIDKWLPSNKNYARELHMMAILSEVCALTPRGKCLVRRTYTVCMLWLIGVALAPIIICGAPGMA